MKKQKLNVETVYSPIFDKDIGKNIKYLQDSPIWANNGHSDDVDESNLSGWYKYTIKFNGLKPVQCSNIERVK